MITICVFGNSIVRSSEQPKHKRWVGKLRSFLLKFHKANIVYNLGVNGETTKDLLKRFKTECKAKKPDIIIINIGTNDFYHNYQKNNFKVPFRKFKNNLNHLIVEGKKFTHKIIMIGLLPVNKSKTMFLSHNTNRYCANEYCKKYNDGIKLIAEENNVLFINLFKIWTKINYKKLLSTDGIHPNSDGHQKIFEEVKGALIKNKLI